MHTDKLCIYFIHLSVGGQIELLQGVRRRFPELKHCAGWYPPSNWMSQSFWCQICYLLHFLPNSFLQGILLYGPPGTGKTLIARMIGKMLKVGSLNIVNGPEILGKHVGESEEKIRNLFAQAVTDQKELGINRYTFS